MTCAERVSSNTTLSIFVAAFTAAIAWSGPVQAGSAPEIRTSAANQVPGCVTPARLMTFLKGRNTNLDPRFNDIASYYKKHGEKWRVRWDYAFFQMAIETNYLTYRRPDGRWGDVNPKQNNFAGIGTTGGGVPGDRFPDVTTGVLGQIQHLVAYSGERMDQPAAPRTQLKQDDIILESQRLGRPVRFSDLARRWAVDPKYGASIEWVAGVFRSEQCQGGDGKQAEATELLPWATADAAPVAAVRPKKIAPTQAMPANASAGRATPLPAMTAPTAKTQQAVRTVWVSSPRPEGSTEKQAEAAASPSPEVTPVAAEPTPAGASLVPINVAAAGPDVSPDLKTDRPAFDPAVSPPAGLGAKSLPDASVCRVTSASYGGKKTVLIKAPVQGGHHYTALTVLDGFEKSMVDTFVKTRAPGGEMVGEFAEQSAAIAKARELCPGS